MLRAKNLHQVNLDMMEVIKSGKKMKNFCGRETEFKRICVRILDMLNVKACHEAKSKNDDGEEFDEIAKLFFLTTIWQHHGQLRSIIEGTASLTRF